MTLFVLIIGISCASAATVNHGTGSTFKKDYQGSFVKNAHPAVKSVSKKAAVKKVTKKSKKSKKVKSSKKAKKVTKKAKVSKKTAKKAKKVTKKANKKIPSREADRIINGWDPKKHQVSCTSLGEGLFRVVYDDGYHRIIDSHGKILTYGY